jgi:CDP-diacylglycerol pyrophosphatase
VTRGAKTVRILAAVAVLTVSAGFAMGLHRMALWQVVRVCVADFKLTGAPLPCLAVNLSDGEARGDVVLRPPLSDDTILVPTRRIAGIEDPFLQSPEAPNYFDAAWRARRFLKGADGHGPERDAIALIVNSAVVRVQDQLHIHVGCLRPSARLVLAAAAPKVPMGEWAQIGAVVPHTMFWGLRIPGTELSNVDPFRLAAEALTGKAQRRGDLTIVVAGVRVEGDDQFLILASYAKAPGAWWPVGDGSLYSPCRAGHRRAGQDRRRIAGARFDLGRSHPILRDPRPFSGSHPWTSSFRPNAGSIALPATFTSTHGAPFRGRLSPMRIPTTRASVRSFMSAIATQLRSCASASATLRSRPRLTAKS